MKKNKYKKLEKNLANLDSDHDGLTDLDEIVIYHTNPDNPDTDHDGISDGDEVKLGRNPAGSGLLKDFFIPHAGNNYHPHSLHPHRLIFYVGAALLLKALILLFVIFIPIQAWLTPDVLLEQSRKIIALTNEIRAQNGLEPLKENPRLDDAASLKAENMLLEQYFSHYSPTNQGLASWLGKINYNYLFAGENLAMGFADAADVVNGWVRSKTHYANIIDPDFKEIGVGMSSGLFQGTDTTLVAQFFGSPTTGLVKKEPLKTAPATASFAPIPAPEKNIVTKPEEKNEVKTKPTIIKEGVLSQKEIGATTTPILPEPIIISENESLLTKEKNITIKAYAPYAEKIQALANGEISADAAITKNKFAVNYYDLTLNLTEGQNAIQIKAIRGNEEKISKGYLITVDNSAPEIDREKSKVTITDSADGAYLITAAAYLSADTKKAELNFGNYRMELKPDASDINKWTAATTIFKEKDDEINNPVVLPSLTAEDIAGNSRVADLNWEKVTPSKPSLLNQYFFLKKTQPQYLKEMFDITSIYYKIILVFLSVALLLNIFIEIKKQRPHIIISTLGVISLLIILIIL